MFFFHNSVHLKVGHSSKFLYQGFAEKYLLGNNLQQKRKLGVSVHLIKQWCNKVDFFALKSDFCLNLLDPHSYFTVFYNDNKCCSILN